jgi:streptogramin lyase
VRNTLKLLLIAAIAVSALSSSAFAWGFGDVFAATGGGLVNRYDADGNFIEMLNTGTSSYTTGMAFDASSRLYVTGFNGNYVARFNPNSTFLDYWGSGYGSNPESIVFDGAGNSYVGQADGSGDVIKFDAAGTPQSFFDVFRERRGSDWVDLAADQKTLYYTSEGGSIFRFDASTNTQLTNFADGLGGPTFALRILGDGSVLVANSINVLHLATDGSLIQSYDVAGENNWFALNVNPDGTSFWSGDYGTGNAYKFDIASGANLDNIATGSGAFFGLTVYGEKTVGVVPEPTTMVLLGMGLLGLGLVRKFRP